MSAARSRDVHACCWDVCTRIPFLRFTVLQVDINDDELDAGWHADKRVWPTRPPTLYACGI